VPGGCGAGVAACGRGAYATADVAGMKAIPAMVKVSATIRRAAAGRRRFTVVLRYPGSLRTSEW
jgi:hypothetical protein